MERLLGNYSLLGSNLAQKLYRKQQISQIGNAPEWVYTSEINNDTFSRPGWNRRVQCFEKVNSAAMFCNSLPWWQLAIFVVYSLFLISPSFLYSLSNSWIVRFIGSVAKFYRENRIHKFIIILTSWRGLHRRIEFLEFSTDLLQIWLYVFTLDV